MAPPRTVMTVVLQPHGGRQLDRTIKITRMPKAKAASQAAVMPLGHHRQCMRVSWWKTRQIILPRESEFHVLVKPFYARSLLLISTYLMKQHCNRPWSLYDCLV